MSSEFAQRPSDTVRERIQHARMRKGWNQRELAEAMTSAGWPIDRSTIAKIESGTSHRADRLTVNEVIGFAVVLGMSPLHLLVPWENDVPVALTQKVTAPAWIVRGWVEGRLPLNERDVNGNPIEGVQADVLGEPDRRFFEFMKPPLEVRDPFGAPVARALEAKHRALGRRKEDT